jgi:hypothetical protein
MDIRLCGRDSNAKAEHDLHVEYKKWRGVEVGGKGEEKKVEQAIFLHDWGFSNRSLLNSGWQGWP